MAVVEEKNLIHGASSLVMAVNNGDGTYATPQIIPGLVEAESESEGESEDYYADDIVFANLKGAKSSKITMKISYLTKWFMTYGCGYKYDVNGMSTPTGKKRNLLVGWCEKVVDANTGEEKRKLHLYYNCKLKGQPKTSTKTNEDKAKPNEIELEFTAMVNSNLQDDTGEPIDYIIVNENEKTKSIFDNLDKKVYIPTF